MDEADAIVIEALLDEVLDQSILADAVDEALVHLRGDRREDRLASITNELVIIDRERQRLADKIMAGGVLESLVGAVDELRALDAQRKALDGRRTDIIADRRLEPSDNETIVRSELLDLAKQWRGVLISEPTQARPIIATLLDGRVTITPTGRPKEWELEGTATLSGLFTRAIFPSGWRPHAESCKVERCQSGDLRPSR
jgi:hypothetical protein